MIQFIEELSFNAWPTLQTMHYDGWILRFAEGYTRRANSVNPIYSSSLPVLEKIRYCEQLYAGQNLNSAFKMTDIAKPDNLDTILESEGYQEEARTGVWLASLRDQKFRDDDGAKIRSKLTDEWLTEHTKLVVPNPRHLAARRPLLENIVPPTCYMSIEVNGETVAMGLAMLERGYMGIFDVVTSAGHRNRGYGTRLIAQLLAWGQANGADHAYLQVMKDNAPALRLYSKFGFKEIYQYWYRVKEHRPG